MDGGGPIGRRGFLALGAGVAFGLSGCESSSGGRRGPAGSAATPTSPAIRPRLPTSTATSPLTPSPALPSVRPWQPDPGDIEPALKTQAARIVEAIGTWTGNDRGLSAAASRVVALGEHGALAGAARPLISAASSAVVEVIEVQYGGLLAASASVLVVCRQWSADTSGGVSDGGTTVDVRLRKTAGRWEVTALRPARSGPAAADVSSPAARVLADPQITLPPTAVADIESGQVHDSVLAALMMLARSYRIHVSVIRSGHPTYVFGTHRISDHFRGRAFDTWRINGKLVVDPNTSRGLIADYMRAAAAAGSYNVGGPVQLSGSGGRFFTNPTHHDHVHIAFDH